MICVFLYVYVPCGHSLPHEPGKFLMMLRVTMPINTFKLYVLNIFNI